MMIASGLLGIHIPKTKTLWAVHLLAVAGSLSAQGRSDGREENTPTKELGRLMSELCGLR
jgi:hypothetical protein